MYELKPIHQANGFVASYASAQQHDSRFNFEIRATSPEELPTSRCPSSRYFKPCIHHWIRADDLLTTSGVGTNDPGDPVTDAFTTDLE